MKLLLSLLLITPLSLVGGGIVGGLASYGYYFLFAVPAAEHLSGREKSDYLHWAGETFYLFAIAGCLVGIGFGIGMTARIFWERRQNTEALL